jgi:hypothetical protein
MKKINSSIKGLPKQAHTSNSKVGTGDYYGTGIKNPIGKSIVNMAMPSSLKTKGKPPRSLA